MMNPNDRLAKIADYAKAKNNVALQKYPEKQERLSYRWLHTLRVAQYGKKIAEIEGAEVEIVLTACLLHDIAKLTNESNDVNHGRIGAKIVYPFLKEVGYSKKDTENICFSIAAHVDGKADFEHPLTIEAKVVSDADKIDRFSNYRTTLALGKYVDEDYENLISATKKRLARFQKACREICIQTESGRKIFDEQISFQIIYMERLIADYEMSVLPKI